MLPMPRHALIPTLLALACFACLQSTAAAKETPPNVIVILVDDLGWADLGCQGSTFYETPRIDGLAQTGLRFTHGYAACAVCSPTRAALLTGRYPSRVGITDWLRTPYNGGKPREGAKNPTGYEKNGDGKWLTPARQHWMEHDEVTLAEMLQEAGYATCHVGKWHLGPEGYYPQDQGFDENHGGCDYGQPPSYFSPYKNKRWSRIPTLENGPKGEYLTDREAQEAADFIRRHRDGEKPFFLYMAHYAVHTPIQAKEALIKKYRGKPNDSKQKNAAYAAMMESLDDAVGTILDALDEHKLTDNTIVIFTSDNGGNSTVTHNGPLRNGKGSPYEGGIRVPLIVRAPGVTKAGSVTDTPAISCDIVPTVLKLTGVEAPQDRAIDGRSIVPLLAGKEFERGPLLWHFPHYRNPWKPYSIIRDGDFKMIRTWDGDTRELYDLSNDPYETKNLAEEQPEKVKELDALLDRLLDETESKLPKQA